MSRYLPSISKGEKTVTTRGNVQEAQQEQQGCCQTWRQWIAVCDELWSLTCVQRIDSLFALAFSRRSLRGRSSRHSKVPSTRWLMAAGSLSLSRLMVLTLCRVPSCLLRKHLELQCGRGHWTVPRREEANCDHSKRCRVSNHLRGISYPSMASRQSSHHAHSKWTTHPPGEQCAKCKFNKNKSRKNPKRDRPAWLPVCLLHTINHRQQQYRL